MNRGVGGEYLQEMAKVFLFGFDAEIPVSPQGFAIDRGIVVECDRIQAKVRSASSFLWLAFKMALGLELPAPTRASLRAQYT